MRTLIIRKGSVIMSNENQSSNKSSEPEAYSYPTAQDMYDQNMHSPRTPDSRKFGKHDKVFNDGDDLYVYDSSSIFGIASAKKLDLSSTSNLNDSSSESSSSPYLFEKLCNTGWGMFETIRSAAEEVKSLAGMSPTLSDSE